MKKVLSVVVLLWATSVLVRADGNGTDILPFSTPGGVVSGEVDVNLQDGTATMTGTIMGQPMSSWGKASRNADGSWDFWIILSDTETIIHQHGWIPLQLHFVGTHDDCNDGDDLDDPAGTIDVQSQTGVGKGSIQLGC
jgi:hypothetical protein